MVLETSSDIVFLLARIVFGVVLAFMGLNHFLNPDDMAGYAESKGIPLPKLAVLGSGAMLIVGGLGLAAGLAPMIAGGLILLFFIGVTPVMHDFWTVEDPEQRQQEMTDFLKNTALAGTALVFIAIGDQSWPLALAV